MWGRAPIESLLLIVVTIATVGIVGRLTVNTLDVRKGHRKALCIFPHDLNSRLEFSTGK